MVRLIGGSFAAFLLALMLVPAAFAQSVPPVVNAVGIIAPPYIMQSGDQLTGFSIDIWNAIAAKLKVQTNYQIAPDLPGLIDAMRSKKADMVVLPAYYSTERDAEFDFTFSVLNAGLLILVPDTGGGASTNPLMDLVHLIFSPGMLLWLGVGLVLILVPAHLFWLLDRGGEDSVSPDRRYFPGIFHAMVWTATALVSQVQSLPQRKLARVLALVWMFVGVVFIAFYTAQLTADLTVGQIRGLISGPDDLPGKRVGTIEGAAVVADYLKGIGAKVQSMPQGDLVPAMLAGKLDAIVSNAAILRYYASHAGMGKVRTVGDEFHKEDLAYVVQLDSPLLRRINSTLIALHEDGTYERLYQEWFGGS